MKNKINVTRLAVLIMSIAFFSSCSKKITTSSGEKVPLFKGTIVYDVQVESTLKGKYEGNLKNVLGNEMHLTIYKNGDIQRVFRGSDSIIGYDIRYIDVEKNQVIEKYKASDSLYVHSAEERNFSKLNNLRTSDNSVKVLDRELKQVAIAAQESPSPLTKGNFLSIKYWYDESIKIDKNKYTSVNDELFNYFINESDGSIFLKYELDYYTYKVVYTAKEILPNTYLKQKEKLSDEVPRREQ